MNPETTQVPLITLEDFAYWLSSPGFKAFSACISGLAEHQMITLMNANPVTDPYAIAKAQGFREALLNITNGVQTNTGELVPFQQFCLDMLAEQWKAVNEKIV